MDILTSEAVKTKKDSQGKRLSLKKTSEGIILSFMFCGNCNIHTLVALSLTANLTAIQNLHTSSFSVDLQMLFLSRFIYAIN